MTTVLSGTHLTAATELSHYDLNVCRNPPPIRSELFGSTPITVFADDREALSVARDLAEIKTAQGDNFPFYVMDMGRVEHLLEAWRAHLPRVQPFYSLKCNADPVLLHLLADQPDVGFYCTNRAEIELALQMADSERILYSNPLWTRGNVRHACANGISLLMFESEDDLLRIHSSHPNAKVILRICVNPPLDEDAMRIGCDAYEETPALLELAARLGISVIGISFSIGAEVSSLSIFTHAVGLSRRIFDMGCALGFDMCILDIGGGFPGYSTPGGPSFVQVAKAVNDALDEFFPDGTVRIIAEPGRYFAASAFSLITSIIDKRAVDASLVTNDEFDAGSAGFVYQTNEGFYGSFGCRLVAHCEPRCRPLATIDENIAATYATILGPTLSQGDVVQRVARLPPMQVGEWLLWDNMGAYSMDNLETLGEEGSQAPVVYYFVGNERWQQISCPSMPERSSVHEELHAESVVSERDVDCSSVESTDAESVLTDEEAFWFFSAQLMLD